jgi:hypothetical protein
VKGWNQRNNPLNRAFHLLSKVIRKADGILHVAVTRITLVLWECHYLMLGEDVILLYIFHLNPKEFRWPDITLV